MVGASFMMTLRPVRWLVPHWRKVVGASVAAAATRRALAHTALMRLRYTVKRLSTDLPKVRASARRVASGLLGGGWCLTDEKWLVRSLFHLAFRVWD